MTTTQSSPGSVTLAMLVEEQWEERPKTVVFYLLSHVVIYRDGMLWGGMLEMCLILCCGCSLSKGPVEWKSIEPVSKCTAEEIFKQHTFCQAAQTYNTYSDIGK